MPVGWCLLVDLAAVAVGVRVRVMVGSEVSAERVWSQRCLPYSLSLARLMRALKTCQSLEGELTVMLVCKCLAVASWSAGEAAAKVDSAASCADTSPPPP